MRLCFVGLVLEVGLSLQGQEYDLLAFVDGLIHANVSGTDGIVMPMRHVAINEQHINTLAVTTHHSKKELMQLHVSDIKTLSPSIMPPYSMDMDDDDEVVGRTRGRRSLPAASPYQPPAQHIPSPPPTSNSSGNGQPSVTLMSALPAIPVPHQTPAEEQASSRRTVPGATAAALYDYVAAEADELSIVSGEMLKIVASHDDGWYLVQKNHSDAIGVVPGNYLFFMEDEPPLLPANSIQAFETQASQASRASQEAFLESLRKSQEASRALESSLSALAAAAASPWILRKAPSIPTALALARQEASAAQASLADIGAAIAHGGTAPQGLSTWNVTRAREFMHCAPRHHTILTLRCMAESSHGTTLLPAHNFTQGRSTVQIAREVEARGSRERRTESWGWGEDSSSEDDLRRRIPRSGVAHSCACACV